MSTPVELVKMYIAIKDRLPYGKIDVNMIEIYATEFPYFLEVRNIV